MPQNRKGCPDRAFKLHGSFSTVAGALPAGQRPAIFEVSLLHPGTLQERRSPAGLPYVRHRSLVCATSGVIRLQSTFAAVRLRGARFPRRLAGGPALRLSLSPARPGPAARPLWRPACPPPGQTGPVRFLRPRRSPQKSSGPSRSASVEHHRQSYHPDAGSRRAKHPSDPPGRVSCATPEVHTPGPLHPKPAFAMRAGTPRLLRP